MEYVIETTDLVRSFGSKLAVNHMNVHVRKGDIYGLIGKNGAGKTTLMKLLLGLNKPNSGSIKLFGSDALNAERYKIGSLIEAPGLYKKASALDNLKQFALLTGGATEDELKEILHKVGLDGVGKKPAGKFSLGMKQRLGIAIALLGNPELLILDEPINGLDPAGIKEIREIIVSLNQSGVTFMISSHLLDELGKIATNYGIVSNGELVEEITADELNAKCTQYLSLVVDNTDLALTVLRSILPDMNYTVQGNEILLYSKVDDTSELAAALVKNNVRIYQLANSNTGFEEFFIERLK